MEIKRKYNTSATIYFPMVTRDAADLNASVSFASGDVKLIKDGGSPTNTTNLPSSEGNGIYSIVLTSTEMQAAYSQIVIVDQTDPKAFEDQVILIQSYGNASAGLVFDLSQATPAANVTQWSGTNVATPDTAGYPKVTHKTGTGTGEVSLTSGRINADVTHIATAAVSTTTAQLGVNVVQISGDATAADNLEAYCDGTTPQPVNVTQVSGDSGAADNLEAYCDGTTPQPVNATQISGSATAADNLELGTLSVVTGSAITGTLSSTQMSTNLTEATNNHFVGRTIIWTSGVLQYQAARITAYNGTTKVLTYETTQTAEAPSNGNTFIIV